MNFLFGLIIFIAISIMYFHIVSQYKSSEDLEIYEMDYSDNGHLQEICDVKQPLIFEFETIFPSIFANANMETLSNLYGQEIMNVKDIRDYYECEKDESVNSIHITCANARKLFLNDPGSHYFTENNYLFMEETGLAEKLQRADDYLKPRFVVNCKYDYITGSEKTSTPLRYHYDYRHFYIVTSGKITVKLTPWKSRKYLHPKSDYENYEFKSTHNAWIQPSIEMEKVKFLECIVEKGNVLHIPPYWWYSIQFSENSSLYAITYNTLMNVVAYSHKWALYFIQQQNIYKKVSKTKNNDDDGGNKEKGEIHTENLNLLTAKEEQNESKNIQSVI